MKARDIKPAGNQRDGITAKRRGDIGHHSRSRIAANSTITSEKPTAAAKPYKRRLQEIVAQINIQQRLPEYGTVGGDQR
ncbi:Uncharacterised protein [Klebsiella pneumoniae]|uniref:Uncharacterized protein n=1 Tax=Klebsiella pneumoniae TaxID=573 RepID=A0A3S4IZK5_KLEPN|nr:Uncharacterised protein [Klebsiella pneumoniae]